MMLDLKKFLGVFLNFMSKRILCCAVPGRSLIVLPVRPTAVVTGLDTAASADPDPDAVGGRWPTAVMGRDDGGFDIIF